MPTNKKYHFSAYYEKRQMQLVLLINMEPACIVVVLCGGFVWHEPRDYGALVRVLPAYVRTTGAGAIC